MIQHFAETRRFIDEGRARGGVLVHWYIQHSLALFRFFCFTFSEYLLFIILRSDYDVVSV
jgi:hypothetical protein